jgi:hypothetical protein
MHNHWVGTEAHCSNGLLGVVPGADRESHTYSSSIRVSLELLLQWQIEYRLKPPHRSLR